MSCRNCEMGGHPEWCSKMCRAEAGLPPEAPIASTDADAGWYRRQRDDALALAHERGEKIAEVMKTKNEALSAAGRLAKTVARMRAVLASIEHVEVPTFHANTKAKRCPVCWCSPKDTGGDGHDRQCALMLALEATP